MSNLGRLRTVDGFMLSCSTSPSFSALIISSRGRAYDDGFANPYADEPSPSAKRGATALLCRAVLGDDGEELTEAEDDVEASKPSTGLSRRFCRTAWPSISNL